jgi:hypothetical protein
MKRAILYLIISMLVMQGFSQGLELYFEGELLAPESEITLSGQPDSGMIVLETLDVKNISDVTLQVKCIRTILENVDSTSNSFCWGVCYPPSFDTSTLAVTIYSQEASYEFSGDHNPAGQIGKAKVKYSFFDVHTPEAKANVFVNYDHSQANEIKNKPSSVVVSGLYPNPANNIVSLDYDFTGERNSKILIYSLLGTKIEEFDVSDRSGRLTLNTSEYNEGIYFCSVKVNNEIVKTQKLFVRHS